MGVKGKLVSKTSMKWEGDFFHLLQFPYQFSQITPHVIQSVDLLSGCWGTKGSVLLWTYNHEGGQSVAKEMIEDIDEIKKSITYKAMEGDPLRSYNALKLIGDVETNGVDSVVTWTVEYEKKNEAVADPTAYMDLLIYTLISSLINVTHPYLT